MFRRLLDVALRPFVFAAQLVRETVVTFIVYWVTRRPRRDDEPPAPPRAP